MILKLYIDLLDLLNLIRLNKLSLQMYITSRMHVLLLSFSFLLIFEMQWFYFIIGLWIFDELCLFFFSLYTDLKNKKTQMDISKKNIEQFLYYYLIIDDNVKFKEIKFQLNKCNFYHFLISDIIYNNEYFFARIISNKLYNFTVEKGNKRIDNILLYQGVVLTKSDIVFHSYDVLYKKYWTIFCTFLFIWYQITMYKKFENKISVQIDFILNYCRFCLIKQIGTNSDNYACWEDVRTNLNFVLIIDEQALQEEVIGYLYAYKYLNNELFQSFSTLIHQIELVVKQQDLFFLNKLYYWAHNQDKKIDINFLKSKFPNLF
jgi:hypothetical protein